MVAPSRVGVARTLDPSDGVRWTHTLASVEPPSCDLGQGAESAADCLCSSSFYPSAPNRLHMEALPSILGIEDLTRVPRIQVCRPTDIQDILTSHQHITVRAGLDYAGKQSLGL